MSISHNGKAPAVMPFKDPDATIDYGADWSQWLVAGETITASEWIAPAGITVQSSDFSDSATAVWLTGGTVGAKYQITNRITTSRGTTDDRTMLIIVREK